MIVPKTFEEVAQYVEKGNAIFYFTATWCGDCRFIEPQMPAIEAQFPEYTFLKIDRDQFLPLCEKWQIMGIPSFVVVKDGKELGRLVNKERKTAAQITDFISKTIA